MTAERERPNVLVIVTDQHRADHVGFAGNSVVRTPHLDAIAGRGTIFDNAWVTNPVCMPNRSSIMTGRMPSAHGVITNDRSLDWGANTFVRRFHSEGWRTGLFGKSHLQHGMSRMTSFADGLEPASAEPWPDGWNTLEHAELFDNGVRADWPDDFYGFDTVELSIDHGARVTGHHLAWALDRGGRYEDLVVPLTEESPFTRRSDRWWQVYDPPYPAELHSTSFVTDRTITFIDEAAAQESPWLAVASFPDPHHPMCPPGEWYDRHRPEDMVLPSSINDPMESGPAHLQTFKKFTADRMRGWVGMLGASDHDLVRECIAATYGLIEMVDDGVGQIMSAIERLGQEHNTIVVFTSDHGDMMGDHGLMLKGWSHYRGTLQVPMVIADPAHGAHRTTALASSMDLGPTLLDLCELRSYQGVQGQSLAPVLADPAASVRDHALVEDDMTANSVSGSVIPHRIRTLIADTLKYTRNSSGEEQLFDLEADPEEMVNLANTRPELRVSMVDRMADALIQTSDDARGAA